MKGIIKEIINVFHKSNKTNCVRRNIELPIGIEKIISVIGVRRCGKTYLLLDTINRIIEKGISKKNIIYINFEDERLNLDNSNLDLILQSYHELYPEIENKDIWFFFDEIQNINSWEKFVRRIYDTVSKNIYITGSNAKFLSSDIATSLRGRAITYEVFPYSFDEYLRHKKIDTNIYLPQNKAKIINNYYEYLKNGGFPETVNTEKRLRNEILRNYFYVMLYKDLIERYKITSTVILKQFIEKIAENITNPFSVNKIYNQFKSQGFKLDKNILYEINTYVENIYLAFSISKFDYSIKKRTASLKKVYFIDNGLLNTLITAYSNNYGKLLENVIYLYLKQNYSVSYEQNIFYYKNVKECDFVLLKDNKIKTLIQVSHSVEDDVTLKRELAGLKQVMKEYKLTTGYIITSEQEYTINENNFVIKIIPAYKLLLDDNFFNKQKNTFA